MKLNKATDYAFRMILHLATLPYGTKITGTELAEVLHIPDRFLLKIMRNLTKSKIVQSYRGVDGGFALGKVPKDISLLDVVEAVEGPAYIQQCLYDPKSCSRGCSGACSVQEAFVEIQARMVEDMAGVHFDELAKREKELRSVRFKKAIV